MKRTGDNGQRIFEDYNQSFVKKKVLSVASEMGALVEKSVISIAHRLPGRNSNARPMIVRFCRRVSKVELLRKKRNFNQSQSMSSVKVSEDLTVPRLKLSTLSNKTEDSNLSGKEKGVFFQTQR